MAAIVAYFDNGGNPSETNNQHRIDGQVKFGAKLRAISNTDDPRDKVYDILSDFLEDTTINSKYKLMFEFKDNAGNNKKLKILEVEELGSDKIILEIEKISGVEVEATLIFKSDSRAFERKKKKNKIKKYKFNMDVVLPDAIEMDGLAYLKTISKDVRDSPDVDAGADYLAPFKLMSRCA